MIDRQAVVETARALNESGINSGTAGNVSVRTVDGLLITPSGVPYENMGPADVIPMAMDGSWKAENGRRPSSEWRFHLDLYAARPDVEAIVHAHPVNATAIAVHGKGIGPFHYMVGVAGGHDIRCAPYETFGTEALSESVIEAMKDRSACLIEHHGIIATGSSLSSALALAVEVEVLASQYLAALAIGPPPLLSPSQMDEVLAKMNAPDGYGAAPT